MSKLVSFKILLNLHFKKIFNKHRISQNLAPKLFILMRPLLTIRIFRNSRFVIHRIFSKFIYKHTPELSQLRRLILSFYFNHQLQNMRLISQYQIRKFRFKN